MLLGLMSSWFSFSSPLSMNTHPLKRDASVMGPNEDVLSLLKTCIVSRLAAVLDVQLQSRREPH